MMSFMAPTGSQTPSRSPVTLESITAASDILVWASHCDELLVLLRELGEPRAQPSQIALSETALAQLGELSAQQGKRLRTMILDLLKVEEQPSWGPSQNVVMDLLRRLTEESRAAAQLQAQLMDA